MIRWILRVFALLLLIAGISLFILAAYISSEVDKGKVQVKGAQEQVDFARKATSGNKYTKQLGHAATQPVQRKIDKGRRDIRAYENITSTLYILAICFTSSGPVLFILTFIRKKRSFSKKHPKRK